MPGLSPRLLLLVLALALPSVVPPLAAPKYLRGFREEVAAEGFQGPTAIVFAPDGRVFVAEKSGIVKVLHGLDDDHAHVLLDLTESVHDYWDRGLLGLALDPGFPGRPYLYVLYAYNYDPATPEAGSPRWPDSCPSPPGGTLDGCVIDGRLSRFEIGPDDTIVGDETVLIENRWCAQFPSHTVDDLAFGSDGALYVSAGDGARFGGADYGQFGGTPGSPTPRNPCGDPPGGRGVRPTPPDAEGGALRAQDLRTPGDPVSFDGTVLRVDPDTGLALPTNPLVGGNPEDDRIVAYGLRNPFRIAPRPGTSEIWIGDVGGNTWEEINRVIDPAGDAAVNFGWPCYEGAPRQPNFDDLNLTLCENLYVDATDPAAAPYLAYRHFEPVVPDPEAFRCSRSGGAALSGLTFYDGAAYPAEYANALFFADYSRACIWTMFPGSDGLPDPSTVATFADDVSPPAQLIVGPDGLLYYVDVSGGRILRIVWFDANEPPVARVAADATSGPVPLAVQFDAGSSTDPDSDDLLSYDWDLDGDGTFGDASGPTAAFVYGTIGVSAAAVRVADSHGASGTVSITITAGNTAPVATILAPPATLTWAVDDEVALSGVPEDDEDGSLSVAALEWEILLHHCSHAGDCHVHAVETFTGVAAPTYRAPDHPWPVYLEVVLRVEDSGFPAAPGGVLIGEDRRILHPRTVALTFETEPSGLELDVFEDRHATPFTRTEVVGSTGLIVAPAMQPFPRGQYRFLRWSDGGSPAHDIVVPDSDRTLVATYAFDCLDPACTPILRVGPADVPAADFTTIQQAIDAATEPGTRIEVLPGAGPYQESVTIDGGVPLVIVGRDDGSGAPIVIDGGTGPAFDIGPGAGGPIRISHLTLAGAIGIRAATSTHLTDLAFESIEATALVFTAGEHDVRRVGLGSTVAAGIDLASGAVLRLSEARFDQVAGVALALGGEASVVNSLIARGGAGALLRSGGRLDLRHSTLVQTLGPAVDNSAARPVSIAHGILTRNAGGDLVGVDCDDVAWSVVGSPDCSAVNDNLDVDPQLDDEFRPGAESPVLDHGPAPAALVDPPCLDLDGRPRLFDHDHDGEARVDPGAFERRRTSPAEVGAVIWTDANTLAWEPATDAATYAVYRGNLGAPHETPGCRNDLDPDRSDTQLIDAEAPPAGGGFTYLIGAETEAGTAGTLGSSRCSERTGYTPCP